MVAAIPFIPFGLVIGALVGLIFRVIPASWLLDYGDSDASVAIKAQLSFTFFPGILLLMLADAFLFWCSRQIIGLNPLLPVVLYIAQPLLLIIISDLKTRIIPDQFILAIVEFREDGTHQVHYLRSPFQREPDFGVTSVNYNLRELLERAEAPS